MRALITSSFVWMLQEEDAPLEPQAAGQKKGRGRPKGSKTKTKVEEDLAPAATAADGVYNMLVSKKLSSKVNYDMINNLFDMDGSIQQKRCPSSSAQTDSKDLAQPFFEVYLCKCICSDSSG